MVELDKTFSVAPMMEWTDRHCRYFHRQLSCHALLFTEMVTSQAIVHGNRDRLLAFEPAEGPVVLQLGGADPEQLAEAARIGESYGYAEINLNCGCPSDRVRSGAFGACLMRDPQRVAACVRAMKDAVTIPVSVKHRIGLDKNEAYGFVRDFVGQLRDVGCCAFTVHARNAWLNGLSPKENRTIPPLRYDVVYQLKREFSDCHFFLNGGLQSLDEALAAVQSLDGVMLGRAAYENPWLLREVDFKFRAPRLATLRGVQQAQSTRTDWCPPAAREAVVEAMHQYATRHVATGLPLRHITRHMLGLCNGLPGARRWRRILSDANALRENNPDLIRHAFDAVNENSRVPAC